MIISSTYYMHDMPLHFDAIIIATRPHFIYITTARLALMPPYEHTMLHIARRIFTQRVTEKEGIECFY